MIFYGHTHEYRFAELTMKSKKKINGVETTCCIFERHAHYKGPKVRPLGLIN